MPTRGCDDLSNQLAFVLDVGSIAVQRVEMVSGVLVAAAPRMVCRQGNSRSTLHMTQTSDEAEGTALVCLHGVIWHSCSAHQETC